MTKAAAGEMVHGLFPVDEGDEVPEVTTINVVRFLDGGQTANYPYTLDAEALPNEQALFALVGGGSYEVIARGPKGRVSKRRRLRFDGEPIPMPAATGKKSAPAAEVQAAQGAAAAPAGEGSMFQLMMVQMQQQQARSDQAAQQNMQFMMTMFERMGTQQQQASQQMTQVLVAALSKETPPPPALGADVLKTLLDAKLHNNNGGGFTGDPMKLVMKGIELGAKMAGDGDDADGGGADVLKEITDALKGAGNLASLGKMPGVKVPGFPGSDTGANGAAEG